MYHVSTQGIDERMINVHYYYYILPESGQMILAHQLASSPDAFCQHLTRPVTLDQGQFCTILSRPSLKGRNQIGCRKLDPEYDPAQFWLHDGRNCHSSLYSKHF